MQDYNSVSQSFTITPGNYTVSTLMTALNTAFTAGVGNFQNIIVTYSDTTNKYLFTTGATTTYSLSILATSTMNSVLGVLNLVL